MTNARGQCSLASAATKVEISVTLPRWSDASKASDDLRSRWNRALRDLTRHEHLHVANAVRTAKAIEDAIRGLPSAADCSALDADIKATANDDLATGHRRDQSYDTRSAHGVADGCVTGHFRYPATGATNE